MKHTNALMLMIAKFLYGEYEALRFSFDFPVELAEVYGEFHEENAELCEFLDDEMPEVCAAFDPHETGEAGTSGEVGFRNKVMAIYQRALSLSMKTAS